MSGGKKMFIIEKQKGKRVAHPLAHYNKMMKTDFCILDAKGKKIIKKMDLETFKLKFE
jgi:hypothetical protein